MPPCAPVAAIPEERTVQRRSVFGRVIALP
jgi:hypothetical protein